ncbi:choice-of-anchor D domain-containing protein, partial [bacterium]|nr:choice-of-anchor D domain-containing protein [bacterium]
MLLKSVALLILMAATIAFAQDFEAEAIMGDSVMLIEKVNLCSEIDIDGIAADDSFPGATVSGDFVYWDRSFSYFHSDSCYWDYTCEPGHTFSGYDDSLRFRFALWRYGFCYCGVYSPDGDTASALFLLCNGNLAPVATWGRPLTPDDIYTGAFYTPDFSQNLLAQLIHHQYEMVTDLGHVLSGELPILRDRLCHDPPADSSKAYLYGFNLLAFSLKNNLGQPIWSIASDLVVRRTDGTYSGGCWYSGTPVVDGPSGIVSYLVNETWCALCDDSAGLVTGTQSRGFSLNYTSLGHSALRVQGGSNNMTEAWGYLDGALQMHILNCCTRDYPLANYYAFDDAPDSVRLKTRLNRAGISSRFRMAVMADSLWIGDVWEDPSPGLDGNPPPLLLKIDRGWNGKLYPEIDIVPAETLDLGTVLVGESSIDGFTLWNIGDTTLIITSLFNSNPEDFGVHYTVQTAAGSSSEITVSFNPSSAGNFDGILSLFTNVPCKSLVYLYVKGSAISVAPLIPHIVEPLPNRWTSCADQPIIIGASCRDSLLSEPETLRINSLPSTTEYFDSTSMTWVPAESVWSSAWGTTLIDGTNWLWDGHFDREECIDFRVVVEIPEGANIDSASISLYADNEATVYANGAYVDTTDSGHWYHRSCFDLSPFFHGGSDTIIIHACDVSGVTAGLDFYIFASYEDICCRSIQLETVVLDVDSVLHSSSDGSISIVDDTLIVYNPLEPFANGDTVHVCLASAADSCGAIFDNIPLCWDFYIDLSPPMPFDISPADGAVIQDSLPTISIFLFDSLSGIDTATIALFVDGDSVAPTITPTDDHLLLEWTFGTPLNSGDTVVYCIRATDSTDYCPDNILDSCFDFVVFSEGPVARLISPDAGMISACVNQQIIISIVDSQTIDAATIVVVIGGDTLDLSDPRLSFDGDSLLTFAPNDDYWNDADTITVKLVSAADAFGAP